MKIDDVTIGMTVREALAGTTGVVVSIDYDEYVVWVRMERLGIGGTEDVDIDPGDLEPVT